MSESFALTATLESKPLVGNPSGQPSVILPINEKVTLERSLVTTLELTSDSPVIVNLGPITNVNVLMVRAVGSKVRLRVTSADGTNQAIPVDPVVTLINRTIPITAVEVMRTPTYDTTVFVFLGEIPT